MYRIISVMSVLIRSLLLPNPFENLTYGIIINWIASLLLYPITFAVVGLFYEARSNPALGSILYLVFYAVHTALLMIWGVFNFGKVAIAIISILYIGLLIFLVKLKNTIIWG